MTIKKKLGLGIGSALMGAALIGSGTVAYFSDKEVTNNTVAAGTLDLTVKPATEIIQVGNIKPGDTITRDFELVNSGTLNIEKVFLYSEYKVKDTKGDNTEDFGDHIKVTILKNTDKGHNIIKEKKLSELVGKPSIPVNNDSLAEALDEKGIKAGHKDSFKVRFEFVDNGGNQNQFQGDTIELKWTFDAQQGKGEKK
ncbi:MULTISPECIES: TasA family protein [unclassified Bacillus cereus group]|uniref:TasA family protein n=1 Tax=unclassified Bacillus cereus group TaxID=2750818 RepID=UPI001F5778CF|nr:MULTISPECIES: TasA family protein [unclassified Bacillus cereus group]